MEKKQLVQKLIEEYDNENRAFTKAKDIALTQACLEYIVEANKGGLTLELNKFFIHLKDRTPHSQVAILNFAKEMLAYYDLRNA